MLQIGMKSFSNRKNVVELCFRGYTLLCVLSIADIIKLFSYYSTDLKMLYRH